MSESAARATSDITSDTTSGTTPHLAGTPVVCVDSSVAFKWFSPAKESGVAEALDLLRGHATGELMLVAPGHMPGEVLSGLRYAGLGRAALGRAAAALDDFGVGLFPLRGVILCRAAEIADLYDLTIHDSLFAALAAETDAVLVTADRKLARFAECQVRLLL